MQQNGEDTYQTPGTRYNQVEQDASQIQSMLSDQYTLKQQNSSASMLDTYSTEKMSTTQDKEYMMLGRYRLLRRIGRGGMGEVWLGEDPRLHRQVAIKTLPSRSQDDRAFLQRFEREARAAASLNHPHILPIHDYGEQPTEDGQAITYIVMPFVAGGTLTDRIKQVKASGQQMSADEALNHLSQAAEAIDYAHEQHVLHRDIKPGNILLRNDTWLLLADFGIARMLSEQGHLTQAGVGIGTPEYMAPEQAQGNPVPASDNYSLAVIAYQLFTGQLPFTAETPYATTVKHIITPPPPPREVNPTISPALEQILLRGLEKDPTRRPATAHAFVAGLKQALQDSAPENAETLMIEGPPTPVLTQQPSLAPVEQRDDVPPKGVTRRQILIGGLTGATLLIGGGLGVWTLTRRPTATPIVPKPTPTPNPNAALLTLLGHTGPISSLVWSPTQEGVLASGGQDVQALLWNIAGTAQKGSQLQPKAKQQFTAAGPILLGWSPDGKTLAIANSSVEINSENKNVVDTRADVYESDLSRQIPEYDKKLMTFFRTSQIGALAWVPDKYLVTISLPHELAGKGEYLLEFRDPRKPDAGLISIHRDFFAYSLATSPDGKTVAVGTGLGVLFGQISGIGKGGKWTELGAPQTFEKKIVIAGSVTWSPDGRYLAAINNHQFVGQSFMPTSEIGVCDWQSKATYPLSLPSDDTIMTTLDWCPAASSKQLAGGTKDGSILLWNVDPQTHTGNTLPTRSLQGIDAGVTALAWSPDGRWLAAGYNDTNNSILLWKF